MIVLYILAGLIFGVILACVLSINALGSQISKEEEKIQLYEIKSDELL